MSDFVEGFLKGMAVCCAALIMLCLIITLALTIASLVGAA